MQTKDYNAEDTYNAWKNLNNCTIYRGLYSYSIKCEIDYHKVRLQYNLRVIQMNNRFVKTSVAGNLSNTYSGISNSSLHEINQEKAQVSSESYTVLVPPSSKGHYRDGFLCYPAHSLINLRSLNVTSNSAVIAWSFYPWDLEFIRYLRITVKEKGESIMVFNINCQLTYIDQHQQRIIKSLEECHTYTIEVLYEYTLEDSRTEYLVVNTVCTQTNTAGAIQALSSMELLIVISCSFFLLVVFGLLGGLVYLARHRYQKTKDNFDDIIDVMDVLNG